MRVADRRGSDRTVSGARLRDNALAIVAHDLRSPLTSIMMAAELLKEVKDEDRKQHFLDLILRAAHQADFLIHDLMDVTRIENRALTVERTSEPAGYLISSVVELFEESATQAGLLIACDVSSLDKAHILVDSRRFVQALSNLISNAIKFTSPGGSIRVSGTIRGECVEIAVQDDGIGIGSEEMPHIFERFWQANHHHRAGAGLGLAITRGIVKAHGGHIGVQSSPGVGSNFVFTIPVSPAPESIVKNEQHELVG